MARYAVNALRPLGIPIAGVLVSAIALGVVAWLLAGQAREVVLPILSILVPSTLAVMFLFYRQSRTRQATQQTLQGVQARVSGIAESAMDPIISVDENQRVVMFNAAAEQAFGRPRGAVLGQPLDMLIPARFHAAHRAHVTQFRATGVTSRRMGGFTALTGMRANGEEFPIEASISQHVEDGRKVMNVILRDITERMRAHQALAQSKEELRELATAASSAREQEQGRLAREVHDELAQAMSMLKMDISFIRGGAPQTDAALAKRLDRMEAQIDATIAAMRRIAADLRPLVLDDLGFSPAIETLVHDFERRTGVRCELALGDPDLALPAPQATAVFRIVQESLTNVAKHAKASNVEVIIGAEDDAIAVTVRDDGVGFSTSDPRKPQSYGLLGVRERAYLLGGETRIISSPGAGTEIEVRLPRDTARPA